MEAGMDDICNRLLNYAYERVAQLLVSIGAVLRPSAKPTRLPTTLIMLCADYEKRSD